ncbi:MAG: hypothetical protein EOO57_13055 [Hymenobacter sp.]|nr:MAG: hypothetical protein EOO57_13055 [Hymenobacter sp.]
MSCSTRLRLCDDYTRVDGSMLHLLVIIHRQKKCIPLELHWPAKYFNKESGQALPRRRGDREADDLNLQAGQKLARANNIFVE